MSNVVDLAEFRKKQKPTKKKMAVMAFEPDQYYIYPDLGIMVHCLFITDKSLSHKKQPIYVMEDQYGNFFADTIEEDTCRGWHDLSRDVFIKAVKDLNPDNDPSPRVG